MGVTKEELRRYRLLAGEVADLRCEIAEVECLAVSPRVQEYGVSPAGGGSFGDRRGALIARLDGLRRRYVGMVEGLVALRVRIEDEISVLDEEEQRLVRLKYFRGLTWEEVAVRLGVSWRTVHNWHGRILRKLNKEPSVG